MKTVIITRDSLMGHTMPTVIASYTDVDQLGVIYVDDYNDWYAQTKEALQDESVTSIIILDIPFKVAYANDLDKLKEQLDMPFTGLFWLASYGATLPTWVKTLPEGTGPFPKRVEVAIVQSNLMRLQWAEGGYLYALNDYYTGQGVGIPQSPANNLFLLDKLLGRTFFERTRFTNLEKIVAQYQPFLAVQEQQLMYYVLGKAKNAMPVGKEAVIVVADQNHNELAGHLLQTYNNVIMLTYYASRVSITIRSKTEMALKIGSTLQTKEANGLPNATTIFIDNPINLVNLLVETLQKEYSWH